MNSLLSSGHEANVPVGEVWRPTSADRSQSPHGSPGFSLAHTCGHWRTELVTSTGLCDVRTQTYTSPTCTGGTVLVPGHNTGTRRWDDAGLVRVSNMLPPHRPLKAAAAGVPPPHPPHPHPPVCYLLPVVTSLQCLSLPHSRLSSANVHSNESRYK